MLFHGDCRPERELTGETCCSCCCCRRGEFEAGTSVAATVNEGGGLKQPAPPGRGGCSGSSDFEGLPATCRSPGAAEPAAPASRCRCGSGGPGKPPASWPRLFPAMHRGKPQSRGEFWRSSSERELFGASRSRTGSIIVATSSGPPG